MTRPRSERFGILAAGQSIVNPKPMVRIGGVRSIFGVRLHSQVGGGVAGIRTAFRVGSKF